MPFKERREPTTKVEVVQDFVPNVFIDSDAITKMALFVDECADEIGWLGTAYHEDNNFYIEDVFLFEQEVHATTTEITPDGLSDFATELLKQDNGMDVWNNMKMWGHSHVNMGLTPSGQDDSQMETFKEGGHDWFIRLIANKKGELKIDIYDYKAGVVYLDMPWCVNPSDEEQAIEEKINELYTLLDEFQVIRHKQHKEDVVADMKVKVSKKTYTVTPNKWTKTIGTKKHNAYKTQQTSYSYDDYYDDHGWDMYTGVALDDIIHTDDDVLGHFNIHELVEFAECETLQDMDDIILTTSNGAIHYTDNDLERIYRVAIKSTMKGGVQQ